MIYANYLELKEMTENKQLTDIYLICKGWYNKKLYGDELEAMNAYDSLHPINKKCLLNDCYNAIHFPKIFNKKNPDFKYSFYINEPTIDELKAYMSSNKFIEYCAKEMYDIFREEYLKDLQKESMERKYSNEENI